MILIKEDIVIIDENTIIINNEEYIDNKKGKEILETSVAGYQKNILKNIPSDKVVKFKSKLYVQLEVILELKRLKDIFWNTHLEIMPIHKKYPHNMVNSLERIEIPYYAKNGNIIIAIKKCELEEKMQLHKEENSLYMTRSEAMELLNLTSETFTKMMKQQGLQYKFDGYENLCLKDEILFLHQQQSEVGKRYISTSEVTRLYGRGIKRNIKGYPLPYFAKKKDIFTVAGTLFYDREEIEKYIKKREEIEVYYTTEAESNYQTFLHRLNLKIEMDSLYSYPYTFDKWFNHVNDYLENSPSAKKQMNRRINEFISTTLHIYKFLKDFSVEEIYELSYNHINLLIKTANSQKASHEIYKLIRSIASDIELKLESINSKGKKFEFSKIENPLSIAYENSLESTEKDIYPLSEYKALFNFLNDAQFHIDRITLLKTQKDVRVYLSIWLYLILHLNNAWRNGDVVSFPRLHLEDLICDLKIDDLKWFEKNKISLETARRVIARVIQYEFKVNKTRMDAHFFCSDTLATTFVTVLLMIEVHIRVGKVLIYVESQTPVMNFYNKYNEPHRKALKNFIDCEELKDFVFSSKKMNSSIMTYIYNLSNEMDNLLLPKYMRAHLSSNSTLHYVKINKMDIEFLTEQLFQRGEFGYILDTLVDITTGKSASIKSKTQSIKAIKDTFGNVTKVEATFRLLNSFVNEQNEILDMLLLEGYDNCIKRLEDIYMNNIPSKDSNIQCLYSQSGCKCPDLNRCIDCKYSIPSIYALNVLCNSFKEDLQAYISTKSLPKKIKLSGNLYNKKELLKSAIKKYGNEYIYASLDMTREEFLQNFTEILKVDELLPLL